jgi:uncharacterized membrane protein YhaH (DUF805 family)
MKKYYLSSVIFTVLSIFTVYISGDGNSIFKIYFLLAAILSFISIILLIASNFKNEGFNGAPVMLMIIVNILLTMFWVFCYAIDGGLVGGLS